MLEHLYLNYKNFLLSHATCVNTCPVENRRKNCTLYEIGKNTGLSDDVMMEFGAKLDPDGLTQKLITRKHCLPLMRSCWGWEEAMIAEGTSDIEKYPLKDATL